MRLLAKQENIKIVEQKYEDKNTFKRVLVDTAKIIFMSMIINKHNIDKFKLKQYFLHHLRIKQFWTSCGLLCKDGTQIPEKIMNRGELELVPFIIRC